MRRWWIHRNGNGPRIEATKEGRDEVVVRAAKVLPDGKSVFIQTDELKPVMQMELRYNLPFTSGASAAGPLYLTLNKLDEPFPR